MKKIRLTIYGRVQGVSFRYYAYEKARMLDLAVIPTNRPDGSLIIDVEGPDKTVDDFIAWARTGPPGAKVREMKIEP